MNTTVSPMLRINATTGLAWSDYATEAEAREAFRMLTTYANETVISVELLIDGLSVEEWRPELTRTNA